VAIPIVKAHAPLKCIISGEHAVVHGCPGIAISLEPFNTVELLEEKGEPGLVIQSERGKIQLDVNGNVVGKEDKQFLPFVATVKYLIQNCGLKIADRLILEMKSCSAPKGTGNSASLSAGLARVLFFYMGREPEKGTKPEENELWMAVQAAEEVAHGSRPSGNDAMTVCFGSHQLERGVKNNQIKWYFEPVKIEFPKGTKLLIIDTYKSGERAKTGDVIRTFCEAYGLMKINFDGNKGIKSLTDFTPADHQKLAAFRNVFNRIKNELTPQGNAELLGKLLDENHSLLQKGNASTTDIDKVIETGKKAGALGGKLTGAGGQGGAAILLVPNSKAKAIEKAVEAEGFKIFAAHSTDKGVQLFEKNKEWKQKKVLNSSEVVDWVNEKDEIIGQVTRKEAHARKLLHRVIHVVIRNSQEKVLCLKRSENADTRPGFISNCAEHVKQGEGYEAAAQRALTEELGIRTQPEFKGTIIVKDKKHNQLVGCFIAQSEGPFSIDKSELESAEFREASEIKKGIQKGEKYTPTFVAVFKKIMQS
jgi:mevalonate kinase/isopentenyldiphosphate isomerase